jgi:hypothetical protein
MSQGLLVKLSTLPNTNRPKRPLVSASRSSALLEAGSTVYGSAFGWLERNFRLLSTVGACRFVCFALETLSICHLNSPPIFSRIQPQEQLAGRFEGPLRKARVPILTYWGRLNNIWLCSRHTISELDFKVYFLIPAHLET